MFTRIITDKIAKSSLKYRAISLVGPRQSGKTTLSKMLFPQHEYLSLENPDIRRRSLEDARAFLGSIKENCILDEIQNSPELFSYLQEILDDRNDKRQFILTGSNSLLLNKNISQSLAGRVRIFTILPLIKKEIPKEISANDLDLNLLTGSYPAIYDRGLNPSEWYADYYNTYVQKDVRQINNIKNLTLFDKFIRVVAGRIGQLINFSSLSNDIGIEQTTAAEWLNTLEVSYITFKLLPHHRNFSKRIIKSPKLFFYDTGLLCHILGIKTVEQLSIHPLRGSIFENWVISEHIKGKYCLAEEPNYFFWRDQHGHEIDLVYENKDKLIPIEIKSGATFSNDWLKNIKWFNKLQNNKASTVIYGGDKDFEYQDSQVRSWLKLI